MSPPGVYHRNNAGAATHGAEGAQVLDRAFDGEAAVLLVGGEELVDLGEVEGLVELGLVNVRPNRAVDLALGQLGPVKRLERVGRLRNVPENLRIEM